MKVSYEPNVTDAFNQWTYVFLNFGIPPEDTFIRHACPTQNYYGPYYNNATCHEKADEICLGIPLIVVQPANGRFLQGQTSLVDFVHPADALYLFGGDSSNLEPEVDIGNRTIDHSIFIPVASDDGMYSANAAAVVFYDRMVKNGN